MKSRLIGILCLAGISASALAEDMDEIKLPAPKDWKQETIALPPGFARDMKFKGNEHIRFAPGMFKPESDSFFSYLFVFELEQKQELKPKVVKQEFLKYYRGLAVAVLGDKGPKIDPATFTLKIKPDAKKKQPAAGQPKVSSSTGELNWVEPFVTKKPQKLRLEIQTWKGEKHTYMFVCVSPKPKDAAIWKQLRKIRKEFHKRFSKQH